MINIDYKRRWTALLTAGALLLSLAACGGQVEDIPSEPEEEEELPQVATVFLNPLPSPFDSDFLVDIPNLLPVIAEFDARNEDTVGWLQVPGTTIDDVVLYYDDSHLPERNSYYLRKNFDKLYSFDGSYFADYRCTFDGTADGLRRNTVIYGHSMSDDYEGKLLSQLKKFDNRLNPDGEQFAREHPYLFFSVEGENLAWEIFAVFDATVRLPYNIPESSDEAFMAILDDVAERSIYHYDVELTPKDKILTISTCTYKYDSKYPNDYRFAIMAKLVTDESALKQTASFTLNPSPHAP